MEHSFWYKRWELGQIGFHQSEVNPYLEAYVQQLPMGRILVPLCGKSRDMIWLAEQGYEVVGVELSALAAESFFNENRLPFNHHEAGPYTHYQSGRIEILCGDFFKLTSALLGEVTAVFDRAALIALPPDLRRNYAAHLSLLLDAATPILLITINYPQAGRNGPPFAVTAAELQQLYGADFSIELLEEQQLPAQAALWGLPSLTEQLHLLRRQQ